MARPAKSHQTLRPPRISVRVADVAMLLRLYQATEQQTRELTTLAHVAARPGWWESYTEIHNNELSAFIALEDDASHIRYFEADVFPGLLQTERYARHLIESAGRLYALPPPTLATRLEVRLRQQELLHPPRSVLVSALLDEAVLLRRVGADAVMTEQLRHLERLARLPNVRLRVLPLDVDHGAGLCSFTMLEFDSAWDVDFSPILYVDSAVGMLAQEETVAHQHRLAHDELWRIALSDDRSVELIRRTARERWGAHPTPYRVLDIW